MLDWNWSNSVNCGRKFSRSYCRAGRITFLGVVWEEFAVSIWSLSCERGGKLELNDPLRRFFSRLDGELNFPRFSLLRFDLPEELPLDGLLLSPP